MSDLHGKLTISSASLVLRSIDIPVHLLENTKSPISSCAGNCRGTTALKVALKNSGAEDPRASRCS